MNLYAIFGRVVQVGLQEGGVNSIGVFHPIPLYLDTVVVMRLVRHPMYLVGISPPYKLIDFSHMHAHVGSAVHTYARMRTRTHVYNYIFMHTLSRLFLYSSNRMHRV